MAIVFSGVQDRKFPAISPSARWPRADAADGAQEGAGAAGPPDGFQQIFNGKDLSGWSGSEKYWSVEDGALTGVTDGTLDYNRFITWKGGKVRNFELRVKVKINGEAREWVVEDFADWGSESGREGFFLSQCG